MHLTFNQVVAGSIPARPTNKSITIPRVCDSNGLEWTHFGHILVTVTIELQMEQALLTVESPVNTGKIWWARLDLNQRPLPCEDSALPLRDS